jgi:hypothetical protein
VLKISGFGCKTHLTQPSNLRVVPNWCIDLIRSRLEEECEPGTGELSVVAWTVSTVLCKPAVVGWWWCREAVQIRSGRGGGGWVRGQQRQCGCDSGQVGVQGRPNQVVMEVVC